MRRLIVVAFAVLGGLLASQLPEFAQQYRQRLGGAIDELTREASAFDADAAREGLDRGGALGRLTVNADSIARARGTRAAEGFARRDRLVAQQTAFMDAGPLARLGELLRDPDASLARATLADYEPAVPTTTEGLLVASLGALVGALLGTVLAVGWRVVRGRRRRTVAA